MTPVRTIVAILAYLGVAVIPVAVFTGVLAAPNFLAIAGLAGAWMALLFIGICASGPGESR